MNGSPKTRQPPTMPTYLNVRLQKLRASVRVGRYPAAAPATTYSDILLFLRAPTRMPWRAACHAFTPPDHDVPDRGDYSATRIDGRVIQARGAWMGPRRDVRVSTCSGESAGRGHRSRRGSRTPCKVVVAARVRGAPRGGEPLPPSTPDDDTHTHAPPPCRPVPTRRVTGHTPGGAGEGVRGQSVEQQACSTHTPAVVGQLLGSDGRGGGAAPT